jgi:hypothetical protein
LADPKKFEYYMGLIQQLEPEPDSSPAYKTAQSERHESVVEKVKGNADQFNYLLEYAGIENEFKLAESNKQEHRNRIVKWFIDNKCDIIDFGENGYIKYYLKSGSKNKELTTRSFKPKNK